MKRSATDFFAAAVFFAAVAAFGQSVTVHINSPVNKTRYADCSDIPFVIDAQATGTTIKRVEIYENGSFLRGVSRSPYEFSRSDTPDGIYEYFAKAIPAAGDTVVSDTVLVFVGNVKDGNLIQNGEFNCAAAPWRFDQYVNAVATFNIVPDLGITDDSSGAYIEIQNIGDAAWAVQLMQPFKLQKGHTYEIRFTAETSEAKDIEVAISQDYDPYQPHWTQMVTVSQWGVYGPYTFECGIDDPKTMFKFVVGGNRIPIAIDAVEVVDKMWTSVETGKIMDPTGFTLAPNYPNPFNPETTILYTLPRDERVRLTICNPVGETVAAFSEVRKAGTHSFRWKGLDRYGLPARSGLYVCRLETERQSRSIKMLLVR